MTVYSRNHQDILRELEYSEKHEVVSEEFHVIFQQVGPLEMSVQRQSTLTGMKEGKNTVR